MARKGKGRDLLSSSKNLSMSRFFFPGGPFGTGTSGCERGQRSAGGFSRDARWRLTSSSSMTRAPPDRLGGGLVVYEDGSGAEDAASLSWSGL